MFHKIVSNIDHDRIKPLILDYIDTVESSVQDITKTDWEDCYNSERPYIRELFPLIERELRPLFRNMGADIIEVDNFWFQQYKINDHHGWHTHAHTHFSNIYYLELPDPSLVTEFIDPDTGEVLQPAVKEGDLLIVPSFIAHRSPVITTTDRKTVIVINMTIHSNRP